MEQFSIKCRKPNQIKTKVNFVTGHLELHV